jgi:hypothetical protein
LAVSLIQKERMTTFKLPDGWTREDLPHSKNCTTFQAPAGGMVTVDFEARLFRLGYSVSGPKASKMAYIGRGWRDHLCADAVACLIETLA